jgi:hypothetical protein
MSADVAAAPPAPEPAPRFESLDALRAAHAELLTNLPADQLSPEHDRLIHTFLERAVATGAVLDAPADRRLAQGLIDYWIASLLTDYRPEPKAAKPAEQSDDGGSVLDQIIDQSRTGPPDSPRPDVKPPKPSPAPRRKSPDRAANSLLVPFSPDTVRDTAAAADRCIAALPAADRTVARRIMLRLVRLSRDGKGFEPVPAARAALYDVGSSEARVSDLVDQLAGLGVVRVTSGPTADADQVTLRSPTLMSEWPAFAGWLKDRQAFREAVTRWEQAGRPADALLAGQELEEVRIYHDRNDLERAFIEQSRYRELRKNERNRLLAWLFGALAVFAAVGWVVAGSKSGDLRDANKKLGETNRELTDANAAVAGTVEALNAALDQLSREQALREKKHQLAHLAQFVRLLSEIGVSGENDPERVIAVRRWEVLKASLRNEPGLEDELRKLGLDLKKVDPTADRVDPERGVQAASRDWSLVALNAARKARGELLAMNDPDVTSEMEVMRKLTYETIQLCTSQIVEALEKQDFTRAIPFINEFWILYWGEMGLFEDDPVKKQMVGFGGQLKTINRELYDALSAGAKEAFDPVRTKNFEKEQLWQKVRTTMYTDGAAIVRKELARKPIPGVSELRTRKKDLDAAIQLELGQKMSLKPDLIKGL